MKNLGITERVLRAGGLIAGDGGIEYARTLAFHTLVLFSLFAVFAARSDEVSAFRDFFTNGWLWLAVAGSLAPASRALPPIAATRIQHRAVARGRIG